MNFPSPEPALLRLALGYAEHAMRTLGQVLPTLLVESPEGLLLYLPEMGDTRAKDNFASTARLVTTGYRATAAALILESWAVFAKPDRPLQHTPPSQSADREEVVMITLETTDRQMSRILLIQRDRTGKFTGFGVPPVSQPDEFQGRFAQIMPPKPPDEATAKTARQILSKMGVVLENQGFNPLWN